MSFSSRLSNGWNIAMSSLQVLRENKQLVMFPLLSGASMIVITISFVFAAVLSRESLSGFFDVENSRVYYYLLLFGFYFINYFIVVFFNVALMHCVRQFFRGEEVNLGDGLRFSVSRLGAIFGWAILAASVGTILKAIQQETGLVGKIVTGIIGIVWNVATFFVVPILAYENAGPIEALKRSSSIIKEKWGESLAGNFSLGLVQFLAFLIAAVPLFIIGYLVNLYVALALAALTSIFLVAIMSTAKGIFISAIYHRLDGTDVPLVSDDMMDDLFVRK